MQEETLRVTRLEEIDWKTVRELVIEPGERRLVLLRGPNASGKSSALDAVVAVLGGARLDPPEPIRLGQERAEVTLTLGNTAVRDRHTAKVIWQKTANGELRRELIYAERTPAGLVAPRKPQTTLSALVGELATDPLALIRDCKPQEQAAALLTAAGKKAEYTAHLGLIEKAAQDARTAHAAYKTAKSLADALPSAPPGTPPDKPDEATAHKAWEDAKCQLKAWEQLQRNHEQAAERLTTAHEEVARAKQALAVAEQRQATAALAHAQTAALAAAPCPETTIAETAYTQVSARLAAWNTANAKSRAAAEAAASHAAHAAAEDRLAAERAALAKTVRECVKTTGLDIEIDEEMSLRVNGVPLQQLSTSEKVKLSAVIAMQQPRTVRIARIDEGDALDQESMSALVAAAEKYDYQLLMTAVYAKPNAEIADKTLVVPMHKTPGPTLPATAVVAPVSLEDL